MIDLLGQIGFTGNFDMSRDSKGRVTTPSPFVKVLKSRYASEEGALVISISLDRGIAVLPVSEWLRRMEKLESLSDLDESSRTLRTLMAAYSFQSAIDANNRIRLPAQLLELCRIGKEVAVIGKISHFEVWDRAVWSDFSKRLDNISEAAQRALAH